MIRHALISMLLSLAPFLSAVQVELTLVEGGEVIKGELISQDDKQVTVKRTLSGKKGPMAVTVNYERSQIAKLTELPSAADEYPKRAAAVSDTAKGHLELARWCNESGLIEQAVTEAKKAAALDPKDADAVAYLNGLGFYEHEGKWLSEADYLAATGKVRVGNRLVTPKEAEELKAKAEVQEAQDTVAGKAARMQSIEKRIAAINEDAKELNAKASRLTAEMANAEGDLQKAESAKAELDRAEANLNTARANATANDNAMTKASVTNAQSQVDEAQAKYNKAKRAQSTLSAVITRGKAELKDLDRKKAALADKASNLQKEKERAAQDLQKATEEAAKAAAPKP